MVQRVFLVTLAVLAANWAAAQTTWESRTRTGEYAFAIGETERAEREFKAALAIAQKLPPPDRRLETSLGNLARLYEHGDRLAEALPMYQLQIAAIEARLGSDSPALLEPLLGLGRVAIQTGDVPAADEALERYRALAEKTDAADPEQRWIALAMLARTHTLQDRPDQALAIQREAIAVLDDARGPTDLERANALESLAQMELADGDPEAAEDLLVRAVELRADDDEGGSIAAMLTAAAETAFGAGRLDVADRLADRAEAAVIDEGGDPAAVDRLQADIAWMRVRRGTDSLGDLYLGASPGPELDRAYDRLLTVHGQVGPDTDPAVIGDNLSRLAQVAALRGEVEDSAHWQRMVVDLASEQTGPDSPQVMAAQENLIDLFTASDRVDNAVTANAWLIAAQERAWGPDSPRLAPVLERQVELLTEAGLKRDAKKVKKRLKKLNR